MSRMSRDEGFPEFVRARRTHLRRIAYAVCGDWHRAEDLTQTALTKLYVAWPRVSRDGREEAYTRTIIVRANLDEHRRPWRRESVGLPEVERAAREPFPVEERSALFDALQALPVMQRKVVVLRHWLGLSVAETAHELRISQGTVKSHSHRGLDALRSTLEAGADSRPRPGGA
ncbi:SigE family RNA polymerase sigma factor [Nocardioides mangrovi]|uniref:SigE family RNA polymerase sigma factor n=1 Tax=Nocardioides mangrovi TaxID=2874580 RepID=A0ABS7UBG4_9ACTN|nr:SigE family RNA polymerase sigma factor [Nocardioides mangrovi]MBZ5738316.1 SigE family RNA polymerase sigma factor [Nocardioides mangrovi]